MSNHLRDDDECQNCGYTVELAYCTKCGQKNTETRQPFHHLFTHFIEDLVHYDGAFWKTIKHLLFRPGKLTREYLEGKRQTYVPPVKLYIFISIITFFSLSVLASFEKEEPKKPTKQAEKEAQTVHFSGKKFTSVKELDDYQQNSSEDERLDFVSYWFVKNAIAGVDGKEVTSKNFYETLFKVLPKILFLYMPVFAFWIWLFHGKKRWYFFDHGIFTLHYFSMLLLVIFINTAILNILGLIIPVDIYTVFDSVLSFLIFCYFIFYFFRAHRKLYGEKRWISRTKCLILFFINMILLSAGSVVMVVYILQNIH